MSRSTAAAGVDPAPAATPVTTGPRATASGQRPPTATGSRLLATLGILGALAAAALVGALHVLPETADISPVRRTISEYALTDTAWAFNVGAITLALGSLAILIGIIRAGLARPGSAGTLLSVAWALALLTVVVFPKNNWAVGPSASGQIHRVASLVAFLCLPVAVMLLTRRRRGNADRTDGASRAAFWLAAASLAWFAPLLVAWLLSPVTGTPWYRAVPLGLLERGLVLCEVTAVIVLGVWVLTATRRSRALLPATRMQIAPAA